MNMFLSAGRVRSAIAGARTEKDVVNSLRQHKIRYTWTTSPGFLSIRVPVRSGSVLIYRTASRSVPFLVRSASPVPFSFPLRRQAIDDYLEV